MKYILLIFLDRPCNGPATAQLGRGSCRRRILRSSAVLPSQNPDSGCQQPPALQRSHSQAAQVSSSLNSSITLIRTLGPMPLNRRGAIITADTKPRGVPRSPPPSPTRAAMRKAAPRRAPTTRPRPPGPLTTPAPCSAVAPPPGVPSPRANSSSMQ